MRRPSPIDLQLEAEYSARLAAIVDSSDDAIASKTLEGIITSWNKAAEKTFGYAAAEVMGKPITIIIPHDRLSEEAEVLRRIMLGERVEHFETVRLRKDGTQVEVSLTVSPLKDQQGRVIKRIKIARDITAQKRSERSSKPYTWKWSRPTAPGRVSCDAGARAAKPLGAISNSFMYWNRARVRKRQSSRAR
jgi:PAS domain S-box-containing protein